MFLPEFAIRRPVTTFMLICAITVFGIIGFLRLGVDQYPRVEFPVVTVTTLMEGASPEVMEETVTDIIEEEVATIEGIRNLSSISSHGASVIIVEFEMERDIDIAAQDVRDKVGAIINKLPEEAERPVVGKLDIAAQPVIWIAVYGDRPIVELTSYAEDVLKPKIETLKGVGSIILGGKRERTIRIWLDRTRLEAKNISVDEVISALKREHVEIPGGWLKSTDIEFSIKIAGEFKKVSEFNDLIVAYRDGYPIRLSDVGYAEDGLEDKRSLARYNGVPAVGLGIRKKPGANTVELARLVRERLAEIQPELPAGIRAEVAFDASTFIKDSMDEMEFALLVGGVLAMVVVFLFLRNLSATLITGITIPVAITGAFVFLYFMGFTLNTMTMLGLTLAIGLVIDDAIIVIESIYRKREEGLTSTEAARSGTQEIAFAAMAATFSLVAVFTPVAFMKGIVGSFFYEFGLTVAVAVLISLFVALTFTPMASSRFLKETRREGTLYKTIETLYRAIEAMYVRLLSVALSHRFTVVVLAVALFAGSLMLWKFIGKEFIPRHDQSRFMVRFETPVGSSIDYTDKKLRKNEDVVKALPEVEGFFGAIGIGESASVHKGFMFIRLLPKSERERSQHEVMAYLRERFNQEPGMRAFVEPLVFGFGARRGPPLEFIIKGPSIEGLNRYSQRIAERFSEIEGVVDVDTDFEMGLPELKININRERARELGVDTTTVATTIGTLIGGRDVVKYKEGGKQYDVRVKLLPTQRDTPSDIEGLFVKNREGVPVKLSNLVTIEESSAPSVINRRDRERSVTIFANTVGEKTLGSAIEDIKRIAEEVLPEGYTTRLGGRAELMMESVQSMLFAFFLAVLITYMVLASQFESFVHPFTVMLALPLSMVGALGLLWVTGNTINIYSLIGITLLVGLVTKNSILLVDYANRLRATGTPLYDAIKRAGSVRLRPILMTAFSTIFGVLPTAIGVGPGSEVRAPMAIATIGGLFASTLLTLVVVPVVYTIIDERRRKKA